MIPYYRTITKITTFSNNDKSFTVIGFLIYLQSRKGNSHAHFNTKKAFSESIQSLFMKSEFSSKC